MKDVDLVLLKEYLQDFKMDFPEISKIFLTLSSGCFINRSSSSLEEQRNYKILEANTTLLKEYFLPLGFELVICDGYCFFTNVSPKEEKLSSENQIQLNKVEEYLDIFILLKTIFNSIDLIDNFEFTLSNLEDAINSNMEYKSKVPNLNKSESNRRAIEVMLSKFSTGGFIEEIDKKEGRYKTLDCLKYLVDVAYNINIVEEN